MKNCKIKKIGIVTLSDSKENYGQILQSYALITFLKQIGFDAFLIRVKHKEIDNSTFLHRLKQRIRRLIHIKSFIISLKERMEMIRQHNIMEESIKQHDRKFEQFIVGNIPCTQIWYDDISINENPPEADAYICGSDQIWGSDLSYMYLDFAKNDKVKISYAASFGGLIPDQKLKVKISRWLSSFFWITVRENTGLTVLKDIGVGNAEVVPDPTLLLDNIDYSKLFEDENVKSDQKYVFLYLLGNKIALDVSEIFEMAKKYNLKVVYVTAHGRNDSYEKNYPTINSWLRLISNSEAVITNSYHCTIFSMIFRKKFLSIPIIGVRSRMNTRIIELLEKYSLTDRLQDRNIEKVFEEIDYSKFNQVCSVDRKKIENKFSELLNGMVV